MDRIFLSPPDVGPLDRELLLDAFDSNWIAPVGPYLERFEADAARATNVRAAAALSSGTAALHLALLLVGVQPGDDVIVPTLTFVATANVAPYLGARPVFVDSSVDTWTIDPDLLEEELEARVQHSESLPAAVIAVDLYGQCADYDRLTATCDRFGVPLIEDAAEALGSTYRDRHAGELGVLAALSFNGNKLITTSGGGMLVSNDVDVIQQARFLATQARDPAPHYGHSEIGYNYRLSNLLAAIGCAQLADLDRKVLRRRAIKRRYREAFADLDAVGFMPDAAYGQPNNWLTVITLDPSATESSPTDLREHLERLDIEARPGWKPMHLQPAYKDAPSRGGRVAEQVFNSSLCLPSGSAMSDSDQDRVIEAVRARLSALAL
ncbi:MAG: aminotransferase class I/II-fold pyridoxal phosphate-dependent enzyme [Actinobacteria bacterium]|nr:aminotransferase class I/II-fold pyridoxal phosphate-dependent enzyme [Actinomycetota bacterium]